MTPANPPANSRFTRTPPAAAVCSIDLETGDVEDWLEIDGVPPGGEADTAAMAEEALADPGKAL
jgi:hypothetical protein